MKKVDETALAILLKSYMMKAMTREEAKETIGQIVVVCRNGDSVGTAINVEKLAEVMDKAIIWGRRYLKSSSSSCPDECVGSAGSVGSTGSTDSHPMTAKMREYVRDDLLERVSGEQFANNLSDCIVDLIMSWYWFSRD